MPEIMTLPSGLTIVCEPMPHTHSASLGFFTRVGARHEPAALSGASHFVEHMLFKGTRRRPTAKQISETVEGVGGILNAYTDFETTAYYAKVADMHFPRALDLLVDMLREPLFDPKEIEKERRVIIEELRMTLDSPGEWVHMLIDEALWGEQPLGRDIAGSEETVGALTREALLGFRADHYHLGNTIVSIAGNIDVKRVSDAVMQALDGYPQGTRRAALPTEPPTPGPLVLLETDDTEQANLCVALPGLSYHDPDRRALQVLDRVLGGDMSSRLFQELREERGLAYEVESYAQSYGDAGKWTIYAGVEPSKAQEALVAVLHELRRLRDEGISDDELQRVKEQVKGGTLLNLEDTWSVASRNGSHLLHYGRVLGVEQSIAEIEAVTADDVRRVAKRVIHSDALHLALIGPFDDDKPFEAALTLE
jgi:predicted Zn-dependent peptidase